MEKTAVEWLIEELEKHYCSKNLRDTAAFTNAMNKEQEQIKQAYGDGLNAHRTDFCNRDEYYIRTFGIKP